MVTEALNGMVTQALNGIGALRDGQLHKLKMRDCFNHPYVPVHLSIHSAPLELHDILSEGARLVSKHIPHLQQPVRQQKSITSGSFS